jgi:hypothetical protein
MELPLLITLFIVLILILMAGGGWFYYIKKLRPQATPPSDTTSAPSQSDTGSGSGSGGWSETLLDITDPFTLEPWNKNGTVSECKSACVANPLCVGVNYNANTAKCNLLKYTTSTTSDITSELDIRTGDQAFKVYPNANINTSSASATPRVANVYKTVNKYTYVNASGVITNATGPTVKQTPSGPSINTTKMSTQVIDTAATAAAQAKADASNKQSAINRGVTGTTMIPITGSADGLATCKLMCSSDLKCKGFGYREGMVGGVVSHECRMVKENKTDSGAVTSFRT